jgi:hypothetical protein
VYSIKPAGVSFHFDVYCDMARGGWTLVGITNSGPTAGTPTNYDASVSSPYVGEYAKPLNGASGTQSLYECGSSGSGVFGYQQNSGTWTWPSSGTINANLPTVVSENIVWNVECARPPIHHTELSRPTLPHLAHPEFVGSSLASAQPAWVQQPQLGHPLAQPRWGRPLP